MVTLTGPTTFMLSLVGRPLNHDMTMVQGSVVDAIFDQNQFECSCSFFFVL